MFNDSIENNFTLSIDSSRTDRKTVEAQVEYQVDIGNAQKIKSPKYSVVAHQTADRMAVPNKARNIAIFDNLNVRKYHVDNDGVEVNIDYASNDFVDQ